MKCKHENKTEFSEKYVICWHNNCIHRYPCHCTKHDSNYFNIAKERIGT